MLHWSTADERSCFAEDYQATARGPLPEPGPIGIADEGLFKPLEPFKERGQALKSFPCPLGSDAAATVWPQPPELQDFLVQSSDEEDVGCLELPDPQLDSEAEVMAYFKKNQAEPAKYASSSSVFLITNCTPFVLILPLNFFAQGVIEPAANSECRGHSKGAH